MRGWALGINNAGDACGDHGAVPYRVLAGGTHEEVAIRRNFWADANDIGENPPNPAQPPQTAPPPAAQPLRPIGDIQAVRLLSFAPRSQWTGPPEWPSSRPRLETIDFEETVATEEMDIIFAGRALRDLLDELALADVL